jgi:hypothetical protein
MASMEARRIRIDELVDSSQETSTFPPQRHASPTDPSIPRSSHTEFHSFPGNAAMADERAYEYPSLPSPMIRTYHVRIFLPPIRLLILKPRTPANPRPSDAGSFLSAKMSISVQEYPAATWPTSLSPPFSIPEDRYGVSANRHHPPSAQAGARAQALAAASPRHKSIPSLPIPSFSSSAQSFHWIAQPPAIVRHSQIGADAAMVSTTPPARPYKAAATDAEDAYISRRLSVVDFRWAARDGFYDPSTGRWDPRKGGARGYVESKISKKRGMVLNSKRKQPRMRRVAVLTSDLMAGGSTIDQVRDPASDEH